jgi:hypothetical protein|tara:strand:- start:182 stop:385 length:204 start_codon:yes stop_codon:yes gene_type:complete
VVVEEDTLLRGLQETHLVVDLAEQEQILVLFSLEQLYLILVFMQVVEVVLNFLEHKALVELVVVQQQ